MRSLLSSAGVRLAGLLVLALLAARATAAPAIVSETNAFVFDRGEPIRLSVQGAAAGGTWTVRSFEGAVVAGGALQGSAAAQALAIPAVGLGHFTVAIVPADGSPAVESSFAVLVPNEQQAVRPRFGVMTHYAHNWNVDSVPLADAVNVGFVRDELYWQAIELTRGVYAFPAEYDRYMAALQQREIPPLIVLSFANPLYDNGDTPHTDEAIAAFAKYAVAVLRHYGAQIRMVEVWNEYNGTFCTGPATEDRAGNYTRLLRATYQAIKRARPDVTVLGGATAGVPLPYWEKLARAGALPFMDAAAVHPYRYSDLPEGIEEEIVELRTLLARFTKTGPAKPIWATEFGWGIRQAAAPGDLTIDERDKAKFLARGATLLLAAGVQRLSWYLLKDDWDPMGLISAAPPYVPKPAYTAFATFIRALDGAQFVRREPSGPNVYSYLFRRDSVEVRVMWATTPATVPLKGRRPILAQDLVGAALDLGDGSGEPALKLTDAPVYIVGTQVRPVLPPLLPRERLITDAAADFSATQGKGWSYGSWAAPGQFENLTQYRVNDWRAEWGNEVPFLSVTARTQHPAFSNGQARSSVRRWLSPVSGSVRIAGAWRGLTQGDGTDARIYVNGAQLFGAQVGGGNSITALFDFTVQVEPGSTIDFALGPRNDMNYDETELRVRITGTAGRAE
jgi:hypothetical protein